MLSKSYAPARLLPSVRHTSRTPAWAGWIGKAAVTFATLAVSNLTPATVSAQQASATSSAGHRIAVIDVAYIFKNLPTIKQQVSQVEKELKQFDVELKQRRENLQQAASELQTLKAGSIDYARQEEQIASMESKLRLDMARKQNELREAEAKIYYDNYQRIAAAVKAIATHNKINLVLRFNSEEMDLEQNGSVARGVMKNVVYHDATTDMTQTVMRYLEQQNGKKQVATGQRAAARR